MRRTTYSIRRKRTRKGSKRSKQFGGQDSSLLITIYILCFNEERVIEFIINAYRGLFPNCKVIIYDNESTDSSVQKANALNCEVRSFSTGGKLDEPKMTEMRNTVWKDATTPWIIICDMDEVVAVNQSDLMEEDKRGTTILKTSGYEMYGKSEKEDLSNIKINAITSGEKSVGFSKTLCFRKDKIENINFSVGAHESEPVAKAGSEVKFSEKIYKLYHFKKLGKSYYHSTQKRIAPRSVNMRKIGLNVHYTENAKINENAVNITRKTSIEEIPPLSSYYMPQQGGSASPPIDLVIARFFRGLVPSWYY